MIDQLLPLSVKKIEILKYIYENEPVYLRKIAAELNIHPYQTKKILDTLILNKLLEQQRAGRTILLALNKLPESIEQLIYIIEDYKQKTETRLLKQIIKNLKQQFSKEIDLLTCCIFGSYARGAQTKESDVDVLFVIKNKNIEMKITKKLSQLSTLLGLEFSPIIMGEEEFLATIETHEPAMATLMKPGQRIIVFGIEYFIKASFR